MEKEWFASWFDTSYYHTLYKNRNDDEAKRFIQNLVKFLEIPAKSNVLDLACGKGRHANTLSQLGLKVLGVDLSENSINQAIKLKNENLTFMIHDMREEIPDYSCDYVFNLFTSFGYFDNQSDNSRVLQAISNMLSAKGIVVIDFMNATKVVANLLSQEEKLIDGINFQINRYVENGHIYKRIQFEDQGESFDFTEKVQALKLEDFKNLLTENNFEILRIFGDFDLNTFNELTSDRLIIIARKK